MDNLDPKARVGQKITQDSFFQQAPITESQMNKVFGTEDEFLERYGRFQKDYEAAISNKLNHAKGSTVNVELMKRQGKTDLSVLNRETRDKLYKSYMNDVMRMGDLIKEVGLPAYDMPNANLYKDLFQFSVDNEQGIVHPAQILLNRMSVNFDPNKRGLDSLNIGSGEQMSHRSLSNLFHSSKGRSPEKIFGQTPTQGQTLKIATIDIETTGVDIFSDTRSMTIAESILDDTGQISKPTTLEDFNVSFQSNKLSGVNVTTFDTKTQNQAVTSLTEHLANVEVGTTSKQMGEGGSTYLDEVERFFNKLLEADRVAGHNLNFDIDHMISTAMKQDGFGSHLGAQRAIDQFTQRAMDDKEYFVDTLESTRAYIKNQAEQATNLGSYLDGEARSNAYVKNLFAQETLSKVHIGGSASYGSVTNLALNTNLFELIEKDGQAEELFGLIQKGSHVAETDVHLQTYIGNYVQSGRLKIRPIADQQSIGKTAQEIADEALGKTDFGNFARSKIAQSSAVNATTNIANVQHMSETVFKHVRDTPKGLQEVSLSLSREQINQMSGLGLVGNQTKQGTLAYHKATSNSVEGFYFATSHGKKELLDQTESEKIITKILDDARNDTDFALGGSRNLPNITVGSLTGPRNRALESILDTGISYGRASKIDELARISTAVLPTHGARQAASVAGRNSATIQDVTDTLGTTYRELGSGLSQSDQMRVARGRAPAQSVFQQGLNNYDLGKAEQIAKAFSDIGDPYAGVMDMNDRVYSTIMSSATSSTAHAANRAGPAVGYLAEDISHSAKPNLISELGMTFFKSQRDTKVINAIATDTVNKVRLPPEIAREALRMINPDDTIKNVGISIFKNAKAGGADQVNAVWLVEKQMKKESESKQLARNILEIMQDRDRVISLMGGDEAKVDASVLSAVSDVQAAAKVGPMGPTGLPQIDEVQVENLNRSIRDRGIVVAHADETASAEIISNIRQLGIPTDNDVFLNVRTASEQRTGHTADNFVVGQYFDREAAEAAGLSGQVKEAEELVDLGNGRKISKSVHNANQLTEMIEADPSSATTIGKNIRRGKSGLEVNKVAEFYASHKVKMGYGALGLGIAATGYYAYKKGREKQLYEETLQQQPTERNITTDDMRVSSRVFSQVSSVRKDPLVTAGVVGNLDRAKIGHTQMGPNKYNHLFGG
jgi:hypothetical protein